jgi:thiol-disulfide isomerase/thioredoxin
MIRIATQTLALALGLALLAPAAASAQVEGDVGLPLGTAAPAVTVQNLEGNPVQLLDLIKGKPAMVEIWAVWCELCEQLQPQVAQIHQRHGARMNTVAIGVGVGQNLRRIQRWVDEHKPGYHVVFDPRGEAVRTLNGMTTSIVMLFDASGKVVYAGVGGDQDLVSEVNKLLGTTE